MLIDHKYGAHGGTLSAMDIAAIIDTLVDNRIRATYEAVADLVGIDIISLRRELGPCGGPAGPTCRGLSRPIPGARRAAPTRRSPMACLTTR